MQRESSSFCGTYTVVNEKSQCHSNYYLLLFIFNIVIFILEKKSQAIINCLLHLTEWKIEEIYL